MKLYSLSVIYKNEPKYVLLKATYDMSSFQRSSVHEFRTFTNKLIVECSAKDISVSGKERQYFSISGDSLLVTAIADSEYPSRVTFTLLQKVIEEFSM